MDTDSLIDLAARHAARTSSEMRSSAQLAVGDALSLYHPSDLRLRDETYARIRALTSLRYSVGVFHADYIAASEAVNGKR